MNFSIVFCKNRKRLDKWLKINVDDEKSIIDVQKLLEEEETNIHDSNDRQWIKVLILKKIQQNIDKGKKIFFLASRAKSGEETVLGLFPLLKKASEKEILIWKDSLTNSEILSIMKHVQDFDNIEIISK